MIKYLAWSLVRVIRKFQFNLIYINIEIFKLTKLELFGVSQNTSRHVQGVSQNTSGHVDYVQGVS